jgi:hypothetical protein
MMAESKSNKWKYLNNITCKTSETFKWNMEYLEAIKQRKSKNKNITF